MTDENWRPLGFEGSQATAYDALHDGVPDWMLESFWSWISARFAITRSGRVGLRVDLFRQSERVCRMYTGYTGQHLAEGMQTLRQAAHRSNAEMRLADFLLANDANSRHYAPVLEDILRESGSAYRVGQRSGLPGLVRRVPEGVQVAADEVMRTAGIAGARLADAWAKAFGVAPDASSAYALAVRAVEDAAIPIVVPKQVGATLGHVIGQLSKDGDWSLPLTREDPQAPTQAIVLASCRALWKGHHDRHGGVVGAPMSVTREEAETAVTLAVTLVQWFASGMASRRQA